MSRPNWFHCLVTMSLAPLKLSPPQTPLNRRSHRKIHHSEPEPRTLHLSSSLPRALTTNTNPLSHPHHPTIGNLTTASFTHYLPYPLCQRYWTKNHITTSLLPPFAPLTALPIRSYTRSISQLIMIHTTNGTLMYKVFPTSLAGLTLAWY